MYRNTFISDRFNCKLTCDRCEHIKAGGGRCRNRVCFGTPLCWIHTKIVYGVQVRDSTLADAGKGLFATRDFEQGEWIIPYIGELINETCLNDRYGDDTAPYASAFSRRRYIDGACMWGTATPANGLFRRDGRSRTVNAHNTVIENRNSGLWLRARRQISEGDEMFVWYGDDYLLEGAHQTRRSTTADTRP